MSEQNETQPSPIKSVKPVDFLRDAVSLGEPMDGYALPMFVSVMREQHQIVLSAAQLHTAITELTSNKNAGKGSTETILASMTAQYEELRVKHFDGVPDEKLAQLLTNYIHFYSRGLDRVGHRDDQQDLLRTEHFTNTIPYNDIRKGICEPLKAGTSKNLGMKDRMRRSFNNAGDDPTSFSMILMDSRIFLKMSNPTPLDLVLLIQTIADKLQGYGKRQRVTSLQLERALIVRCIMEFVIGRLTYWSVSDILDTRELLTVIKESDAKAIAATLLASSAPKGVNYYMTCLADKCNFSETRLIDAAHLTVYDDDRYPKEYHEQISKILSTGHKYTVEELMASDVPYIDVDGSVIDQTLSIRNGRVVLKLKSPYLSDYFTCYDNAAARINPTLRQLAVQYPTPQKFKEAKAAFMGSIRSIDYLQWVDEMIVYPDDGTEGDPEVYKRSENPAEFDEGVLDCLGSDDRLAAIFLEKVIQVVPRMTYTFVGIPWDQCPKCKENATMRSSHKGFTPIDPVLAFFDHTQMLITLRQELGHLQEEVLS